MEKIHRMVGKAVEGIRQTELALFIHNRPSNLVSQLLMLHQIEGVSVDLPVVNGVPSSRKSVNMESFRDWPHGNILLLENLLSDLFLVHHGNGDDPITKFGKLLRVFEEVREFPNLVNIQRRKVLIGEAHDQKSTGHNVVKLAVLVPQPTVEGQTIQFAFLITD